MGYEAVSPAHTHQKWKETCNQLQHHSDVSNKLANDSSEIPVKKKFKVETKVPGNECPEALSMDKSKEKCMCFLTKYI